LHFNNCFQPGSVYYKRAFMRIVLQRVTEASVTIEGIVKSKIRKGLVVFVGVEAADSVEDVQYLAFKISRMRIFSDPEGKMNLSLADLLDARVLVISQFTLFASTRKGNRPSFIGAAKPEFAKMMYEMFCRELEKECGSKVLTGVFGADMKVALVNDGPVTITMDSKLKE
jgi:D-aminoacyl-tRNA deacylase